MCTIRRRIFPRFAKRIRTKLNLVRHTSNHLNDLPPRDHNQVLLRRRGMEIQRVPPSNSAYLTLFATLYMIDGSERQILLETFHHNFIYSQSYCQKSAEGKQSKEIFFLMYDQRFESRPMSNKPTRYLLDYLVFCLTLSRHSNGAVVI